MTSIVQEQFDKSYISAAEIMKTMGVSRGALLYARRTGRLPNEISINQGQIFIWVRSEVTPYLERWKAALDFRREG